MLQLFLPTLLYTTGASVAFAAENLLPNPGFEADENGDGVPDGWTFSWRQTHATDPQRGIEKQEPDHGWDTQVRHDGRASVRIGVVRKVDDGTWNSGTIPHPKNVKFYRVTAWIRTQDLRGTEARVAGVCTAADGKWLDANYAIIAADRDRDWTLYTGYWQVHPQTAQIRLRLWLNFNYSGTGTAWFDDIGLEASERMENPRTRYVDDTPPPTPTQAEAARGYILFARSYLRLLFPNSVPLTEERIESLSLRAAPGEREPCVLAVRALRELKRVQVSVTDLAGPGRARLAGSQVDVARVHFHDKQGQSRWGVYNAGLMSVPLYLEPLAEASIPEGATQPFWLTVHVPEDATPGKYAGQVNVTADSGETMRVPLHVEVLPIKLAEPKGMFFGMYDRNRRDPNWQLRNFQDMRAHGMTTVGLCANLGAQMEWTDGRAQVKWDGQSDLEIAMNAYVKAGFPEPLVWLMGSDVIRFARTQGDLDTDGFARAYRGVIEAILRRGKELGWPEIIFQPVDEPFEHYDRMATAKRCLEVLKSIPGVRTEEDGPNTKSQRMDEVYDLCDVLVLHDGPVMIRGTYDAEAWQEFLERVRRDKKMIWFYNIDLTGWHPEPMRLMYGFGLWQSGATGCLSWCYQNSVRDDDPQAVYAQPGALLHYYPRTDAELGGPCIGWEAIREGVDDYRYLLTLQQLVEKARAEGPAAVREMAEKAWARVEAKLKTIDFHGNEGSAMQGNWTGACETAPNGDTLVRGDHKMSNGWMLDDYDMLRAEIAEGIIAISRSL